jgi:molybdopterin-guanine dinucleotide biosynthesis protein A
VRLDAFLLAGGRSTRMGRDKATLAVEGRTFLDRVADAVRPLACSVSVVGRVEATSGLTGVPDGRPGFGPLAGIETALAHATTPAAIVVACDLPLISTALVELLVARSREAPGAIVVTEDADGRLAPLCGVYPKAALEEAGRLLDAGERRPRALVDRFPSRVVAFADYAHLPGARRLLRNVNTPEDYESWNYCNPALGII